MAQDVSKVGVVLAAFLAGTVVTAAEIAMLYRPWSSAGFKASTAFQPPVAGCGASCTTGDGAAGNTQSPRLTPPDCKTLCVNPNPVIEVAQDGTATSLIVVCNKAVQPVSLALAVSAFSAIGSDGKIYELNSEIKLSGDHDKDKSIVESTTQLAANACVQVRLDAKRLMSSRPMVATLRNGTDAIATIAAYMPVVPFKLSIDGSTPEKLELPVTRGIATSIPIKNEDPMGYRVVWTLDLGDVLIEDSADVPPNSAHFTLPLPFDRLDKSVPTSAATRQHALRLDALFGPVSSGFITPNRREGRLFLQRYPDELFKNAPLQSRVIAVAASFNYRGQPYQRIAFAFFTFLVLLAGVLTSLCINFMLPMWRKRTALKQALTTHERALNGQGVLIGAKALSSLRVEISRLWSSIASQKVFIPETEGTLPLLETRVQMLTQRIDLARESARVLADAHADLSLSIVESDTIARLCTDVRRTVEAPTLSEPDRQQALAKLKAADDILGSSEDDPSQDAVKKIKDRQDALKDLSFEDPLPPRFSIAGQPAPGNDSAAWTTLVGILSDFKSSEMLADSPSREAFVTQSNRLWKSEIVVEFARLVTAMDEEPSVCLKRLGRVHDLLESQRPGPTFSPVATRQILAEVRQNIARSDVLDALLKKVADGNDEPRPRIAISPRSPLPLQIVELCVLFAAPGLNSADARLSIKCEWTINDEQIEGAEFSTYAFFRKRTMRERMRIILTRGSWVRSFKVKVKFSDGVHAFDPLEGIVEVARDREILHSSTVLATVSMAITVVIITVGLLTVAQEKLQSLDVISGIVTLLALGFGADVVKRSLSKT